MLHSLIGDTPLLDHNTIGVDLPVSTDLLLSLSVSEVYNSSYLLCNFSGGAFTELCQENPLLLLPSWQSLHGPSALHLFTYIGP